jgi:hypothetical protein
MDFKFKDVVYVCVYAVAMKFPLDVNLFSLPQRKGMTFNLVMN